MYNYLMGKELRSITYRLYPNKEQEKKMIHFLDCTRKAYNRLTEICKLHIEHHLPLPSEFDLNRMVIKIRQRNEWMQDVHSGCFKTVAKRVYNAFMAWKKRHTEGIGFPRFKSWKRFDSFTYSTNNEFSFAGKNNEKGKRERIRLGKIGLIKYSNPYIIEGTPKIAIVFRRRIGNHFEWNVSIAFENNGYMKDVFCIDPIAKRADVGIDLGLNNLAILSDGNIIPNDHTYKKKEMELALRNKKLSECEKGSPEYYKHLTKLSHKFKKLRNYRNDMFHKLSRYISENYRNIFMEELPVKEMMEESPKCMKKSYRDAGWGIFTKMICYKAAEAGNTVTFVNPAYTSQLCSSCGTMVPKDLSIREHICPHCGLIMSRDLNAAINILNRGLRLQTETGNSLKCHEGLTIQSADFEYLAHRPDA